MEKENEENWLDWAMGSREDCEKAGFLIHGIINTNSDPEGMANVHTHGLWKNFDHPNLQIVLPIDPTLAGHVLHSAVALIRDGKKFADGEIHEGILQRMPVGFCEARETRRTVLRLILPDAEGKIFDSTQRYYRDQKIAVVDK